MKKTYNVIYIILILYLIIISVINYFQPDYFAIIYFFPFWIWIIPTLIYSIIFLYKYKLQSIILISISLIYLGFFNWYELKNIYKEITNNKSNSFDLKVISLNCSLGNINAFKETLNYNPDIILLQETPKVDELKTNITTNYYITTYSGKSILSKSKNKIETEVDKYFLITNTKIKNKIITIINLRLPPPISAFNILSLNNWKAHYKDKLVRLKIINKLANLINSLKTIKTKYSDHRMLICDLKFNKN